jgi:hypothetical protein
MHYSLVVDDEYGVPYAARTFSSIEEIHEELAALDTLLDDVGVDQAYAIRFTMDQLKQLLHEAEHEPEQLPDRLSF